MTEEARTRGKLKLFLGYADGVGKTYSMLQAAHQYQLATDWHLRQPAGVE